jgi:hypothetical protein
MLKTLPVEIWAKILSLAIGGMLARSEVMLKLIAAVPQFPLFKGCSPDDFVYDPAFKVFHAALEDYYLVRLWILRKVAQIGRVDRTWWLLFQHLVPGWELRSVQHGRFPEPLLAWSLPRYWPLNALRQIVHVPGAAHVRDSCRGQLSEWTPVQKSHFEPRHLAVLATSLIKAFIPPSSVRWLWPVDRSDPDIASWSPFVPVTGELFKNRLLFPAFSEKRLKHIRDRPWRMRLHQVSWNLLSFIHEGELYKVCWYERWVKKPSHLHHEISFFAPTAV